MNKTANKYITSNTSTDGITVQDSQVIKKVKQHIASKVTKTINRKPKLA